MATKQLHALVIGAGASGLLIAQGLKKNGIKVTVFEGMAQDVYENNPRTWTMALHWSRKNVEACLPEDLYKNVHLTYTNPWKEPTPEEAAGLPVIDGKTGEVLFQASVDDARRVVRGKLRELFRQNIDVQFGFKLSSISQTDAGVVATFENGTTVAADFLVGADGAKSVVRDHLIPDDAKPLTRVPLISTNIGCKFTAEQALFLRSKVHPIANMAVHPDQPALFFLAVADVHDPNDPESWTFQLALSLWTDEEPPASNEERMKQFKQLAEPFAEPYRSAARWVPDDLHIPRDRYAEWTRIVPWNNWGGRVTLAGDAAHPMCPFRGQGLNNALQDSGLLVEALTKVQKGQADLASAISAYDQDVYERGKREIEVSEKSMYSLHHYDALKGSPLQQQGLKKHEN